MSTSTISPEAQQLLQFMISKRTMQWDPREGRHPILLVFIPDDPEKFKADYSVYLESLRDAKLIVGHEKPTWYVLGYGIVTSHLYGQEATLEDQITLLWQRYSISEQSILQTILQGEETRKKRALTQLQIFKELEYWSKFEPRRVAEAAATYDALPDDKRYGLQYLRGILRNAETQATQAPKLVVKTAPTVLTKPATEFNYLRLRSQYVSNHIDQSHYDSLTPDERLNYIAQLEQQFDREAGNRNES